ncbi:FAD-binding protein [Cellulophaga sp. E16_2]|uniref:FAD-binding protein n=1 Tax=Cellulophaga sp. E16_2 TaxID=2789297 RepID=UPI001A91BFA8|nr:FAD-binding protein [Cellulophaga sp. E16_2]MBO0590870.1 FAD-binding protein [Cellulophaga sp. E16_2]
MDKIEFFLQENKIPFKKDRELQKITRKNSKVILSTYATPKTTETFEDLIKFCLSNNLNFHVVGQMWNTYFKDSFKCDILISTTRLNNYHEKENSLICQPGCSLPIIAKWAMDNLVADFECFSGIPSTIGGAAINNAGSVHSEMSKVVKSVTIITANQKKAKLSNAELGYKSRNSKIKNGEIKCYVVEVELDISQKDTKENIEKKYESYQEYRKKNIDGNNKSLGSVFVSSSLKPLYQKYKLNLLVKAAFFRFGSLFVSDNIKLQEMNTYLTFLFLGHPGMAKHCDSFNRFVWKEHTTEEDYFKYINLIKKLSGNTAVLENQIKE